MSGFGQSSSSAHAPKPGVPCDTCDALGAVSRGMAMAKKRQQEQQGAAAVASAASASASASAAAKAAQTASTSTSSSGTASVAGASSTATATTTSTPSRITTSDHQASVPVASSFPPPPDAEMLGRGTWTFLHTMAAHYPEKADPQVQSDTKEFLKYFGRVYPCRVCADDFRDIVAARPPDAAVETRTAFVQWMCEVHNEVNEHLGKPQFDCSQADQRWRRRKQ